MKILKIALISIFYLSSQAIVAECPKYHRNVTTLCGPELQKIFSLSLSIIQIKADIALYATKFKELQAKIRQGCKNGDKECSCLENIIEKHSELDHQANLKQAELTALKAKLPHDCKI